MLTPKTTAMNAANAPHWTLYRRTANNRNQPRTVPMRTRPSWLMSMVFLRRMGEIPRIPDKAVGAVLTRNNDAAPRSCLPGPAVDRPPGLEYARRLCARLGIEHRVLAYAESVGHSMDDVVTLDPEAIPCGYCGPFRREALNRAAREVGADYVATGLNLDDTAQSILMNVARGDIERLARLGPHESRQPGLVPRIEPLRRIPEKEVYLYALLKGIEFHDATCPYADRAQRGRFREMLNRLEEESPGTRHAIVRGYDQMRPLLQEAYPPATLNACARCGEPTVHAVCKACELRDRIEKLAPDAAEPA